MLKRLLCSICFLSIVLTIQAQKSKAESFYKAGIQFKTNNNFQEAIKAFNSAILANPKFDSAYVELGNIYAAGGKIDLSIYNYKKALAINPRYPLAFFGLGKLYRDAKKDLDSAIIFFKSAERLDQTNKEVYYGLAWIYNAKQSYDTAINYAVKSLEIDNNYKPAYGELGHAYRATKRFADCIEQLKKNLAISVVDVALLYSGYCYTELKDKTGALQQYEALLKVNEKMAIALKKKIDAMPQ